MSLSNLCRALLLICAAGTLTAAQGSPWLALRDETGTWLTLVEVSPRTEFCLRPQPSLTPSKEIDGCLGKSQLSVEVRLWTPEGLARARRALIAQGRCGSGDPCRVVPCLVDRIGLRHQQAQWSTVKPWVFVSGVLPEKQRFNLRRASSDTAGTASKCGLDALVLEMVSESGQTANMRSSLDFSPVDIQWAMRLLKMPSQMISVIAVSRSNLRQLARELLSGKITKLEAAGAGSSAITPSMIKKTEYQLAQRIVKYSDFKKHLKNSVMKGMFGSRVPADNEKVYILKKLSDISRFQIPIPAASRALGLTRISVSLPETNTKQEKMSGTEGKSGTLPTTAIPTTAMPTARPLKPDKVTPVQYRTYNSELLRRIEKLESMVLNLLNKIKQDVDIPPASKKDKKNEKKDKKPQSVTHIGDCSEVKLRGLGAGIFTLKSTGRRVRCTQEGELLALSRTKGNVDFNRDWKDYRDGFGDPRTGDYWVGLQYLANYTAAGDRCMRLVMKPWKLSIPDRVVRYAGIDIASEKKNFTLSFANLKGNVVTNSLAEMNGRPFSTRDRDHDAFVGNCATVFGGGNWYKSCTSANIFGRHKYLSDMSVNALLPNAPSSEVMCWKGLHRSQGSMCSPLVSLQMFFSSAEHQKNSRKVVKSLISSLSYSYCKSTRHRFTVPATGTYYITAGGGAGGRTNYNVPGGRGALVKTKMFLKRGTKLMISAGCGGALGYQRGHGGNATYIIDEKEWKPILIAGGGGGASDRVPGSHARAEKTGGDAWYTRDIQGRVNSTSLLRPSPFFRGHSWSSCRRSYGYCMTGAHSYFRHKRSRYNYKSYNIRIQGGGGGGGYEGGVSGLDLLASGGGGGSFCDPKLDCKIEGGGNRHAVGFIIMEMNSCI